MLLFVEELASIVLTPFVLYWSLPACVPSIVAFVRDFTVHVDGVGDICSLAAFDFARHGNLKYGSPAHAPKVSPWPVAGNGAACTFNTGTGVMLMRVEAACLGMHLTCCTPNRGCQPCMVLMHRL